MTITYYELTTVCQGRAKRVTTTKDMDKRTLIDKARHYIKTKHLKDFQPTQVSGEWTTISSDRMFWIVLAEITHTDGRREVKNITNEIFDK